MIKISKLSASFIVVKCSSLCKNKWNYTDGFFLSYEKRFLFEIEKIFPFTNGKNFCPFIWNYIEVSLVDRCHLVPRDLKWQKFSTFKMAKFFLSFLESFNNGVFWCFSVSYAEYIARTDLAIAQLKPWRSKIQLKAFSSRVRFQIRIDDLRGSVVKGEAKIDEILGFYNLATDALLNQYSKGIHILQKT